MIQNSKSGKLGYKSNPSLGFMPELEKRIRIEAEDAKRDPNLLAQFDALEAEFGDLRPS